MRSPAYSTRFDDAVSLAVDAFRGVYRKSTGIPYITHLFAVTALVGEHGGDEDQLVAAVLHDYLEDVDDSHVDELRERFGARVAGLVLALSDSTTTPKPPWRDRKERYVAALAAKPAEVKLVSAADKLHNCQSIRRDLATDGLTVFERFTGGREGTLWYYREIVAALGAGWAHPLLDALSAEVAALHVEVATRG